MQQIDLEVTPPQVQEVSLDFSPGPTAPLAHTHPISQVVGLLNALETLADLPLFVGGPALSSLPDAAAVRAALDALSEDEIADKYAPSPGPRTVNTLPRYDGTGQLIPGSVIDNATRVAITVPLLVGGTGTPARPLEVLSGTSPWIRVSHTANTIFSELGTNGDGDALISSSGYRVGIGNAVTSTGLYSIAIGRQASAAQSYSLALGYLATTAGPSATAIGQQAQANTYSVALNKGNASGSRAIAIGFDTLCSHNNAFAFGAGATSGGLNTGVFGSESYPINTIWAGKGAVSASPSAWSLRGTGGSGANVAGGDLCLDAGPGSGNAATGVGRLRATASVGSGSTQQSAWLNLLTWDRSGVAIASPAVPSSTTSSGRPGQIAWSGTHLYLCTAANTWVRAALSTW